ncbi:MAG: hypothetical protein U5L11_06415 [Arhodomonas sp.]|nr:hypothetical protein [Arhodomonas sp.]
MRATQGYERVLGSREMPGGTAPWARLNFAENLLREALEGDPDRVAIIELSETRPRGQLTYGELLA